jgi:hypothetical protein
MPSRPRPPSLRGWGKFSHGLPRPRKIKPKITISLRSLWELLRLERDRSAVLKPNRVAVLWVTALPVVQIAKW